MGLPISKIKSDTKSLKIDFSGIRRDGGPENLFDSVNLIKNNFLSTRKGRKPVLLWDSPPDQVIKVSGRVFYRYTNTLKEVFTDAEGNITCSSDIINLTEYDEPVKRHIILWEGKLCILPDGISLSEEEEEWIDFCPNLKVATILPFTNERTLFYPVESANTEFCDDAVLLQPGVKIKFNWLQDDEFTVVSNETGFSYIESGIKTISGTQVVLDHSVSQYYNFPSNGRFQYCYPKKSKLLNPFYVGYNYSIYFSGHSLWFSDGYKGYTFDLNIEDFLKVGQSVSISGSSIGNNNSVRKIIAINENSITFDQPFISVSENPKTEICITPIIPDFDHIIFTEDRMFGADNKTGKFYISMLKKPFVFGDISVVADDPWSVYLNECATGITLWKDNILCFTETGGFRVLGYTALNFGIRQLSVNGLMNGCSNSLVRLGDTLYYCSNRGIMKYSGGSDKKISTPLQDDIKIIDATTDGKKLYMLSHERIWVYDTDENSWFSEDNGGAVAIYCVNSLRYICGKKAAYLTEKGNTAASWSFETNPLQGEAEEVQPILSLFTAKSSGAAFKLYMNVFGNEEEILLGEYTIKGEKTLRLPLKNIWCQRFSLRFQGIGNITPLDLRIMYRRKGY